MEDWNDIIDSLEWSQRYHDGKESGLTLEEFLGDDL